MTGGVCGIELLTLSQTTFVEILRQPEVCFHTDSKPSQVDRKDKLCLPHPTQSVRVSAEKSSIILMC